MNSSEGPEATPPTIAVGVPPGEEFVADERLLRAGRAAVRVSVLDERALSVGVAVPDAAPFVLRARRTGLPVVRRTSGGTGVLHAPGDLAWSVVLPKEHPAVGRGFVRAYGRIGAGVVRALARHGAPVAWASAPELAPDCCVLSGRGEVLGSGARIVGGAAQHLAGGALLHQGMIAAAVDRPLHATLFELPPHAADRLVGWRELGAPVEPRRLAETVAAELAADFLAGAR